MPVAFESDLAARLQVLAIALATQQEHFGVLHQTIRNRRGDRGVVQNVAPFRKRSIGRDHGRSLEGVPGADDLIQQVRAVLIERQIPEFVNDEERRIGVALDLAHERVIDLSGKQLIEHIHRGGEEHSKVALTGFQRNDLGEHCFPRAWIANQHDVGASPHEVKIEQLQNPGFRLLAALVIGELKRVNRLRRLQFRLLHLPFHRTLTAGFQFQIDQTLKRGGEAKIGIGRVIDRLLDSLADRGQAQLFQLQYQWSSERRHRRRCAGCHGKGSFQERVKVHRKQPATVGQWRVD